MTCTHIIWVVGGAQTDVQDSLQRVCTPPPLLIFTLTFFQRERETEREAETEGKGWGIYGPKIHEGGGHQQNNFRGGDLYKSTQRSLVHEQNTVFKVGIFFPTLSTIEIHTEGNWRSSLYCVKIFCFLAVDKKRVILVLWKFHSLFHRSYRLC